MPNIKKKFNTSQSLKIYNNRVDPTDIVSCYTGLLNTVKHNYFNVHCNDVNIYNNTSIYDYIAYENSLISNEYDNNKYE